MSNILACSDIHLTDALNDEYRWKLFPFLDEQIKKNNVTELLCAGDITEFKDGHKSSLVNRVVSEFIKLRDQNTNLKIKIMKGNHDFIDPNLPYFKFLNSIGDIDFYIEPHQTYLGSLNTLFLPNTSNYEKDWKDWIPKFNEFGLIVCHQTFIGAISESGFKLPDGIPIELFKDYKGILLSGDIHKNQTLGNLTYIGAPYHCKAGDNFDGRVLLIQDGKLVGIPFPNVKKYSLSIKSLDELEKMKFNPGDQVKIKMELEDSIDWEGSKEKVAKFCKDHSLNLLNSSMSKPKKDATLSDSKFKNLSPDELFKQYCVDMKVGDETASYGANILAGLK